MRMRGGIARECRRGMFRKYEGLVKVP